MENAQHTPVPWFLTDGHNAGNIWASIDGDKLIIANASAEDAAFIVKAVNCHDDLLEALRRVTSLNPDAPIGSPPDPKFFIHQAQVIARAAIAKATGGQS